MADREEKTHQALPGWRRKAKEEGRGARSQELAGASAFVFAVLTFWFFGLTASGLMVNMMRVGLALSAGFDFTAAAHAVLRYPLAICLTLFVPLIGTLFGFAVQGGFFFLPSRLLQTSERMSLASWRRRIFSRSALLETVKSAAKILVVAFLGVVAVRESAFGPWFRAGAVSAPGEVFKALCRFLGLSAMIALLTGLCDYLFRLHEFESEIRMTRQEFMEEIKREEGNPAIKQAIRQARRRASFKRARGMHQAAAASVVITNPTHFAVAVRYRKGFDTVPVVVAKGAGDAALNIIQIARLAAVPVVENKPLARALFRIVEVGEAIPPQFYKAVALVLAELLKAASRHQSSIPKAGPEWV